MKKKLLNKLCVVGILGCTLLTSIPALATTYVQQQIRGVGDTNSVTVGSGTRYFYASKCDNLSGTATLYKDVDWSPDWNCGSINLKKGDPQKQINFTAKSGEKFYGHWWADNNTSAWLSISN